MSTKSIVYELLANPKAQVLTIEHKPKECPCCKFKHYLKQRNVPYKVVGQELHFRNHIVKFVEV